MLNMGYASLEEMLDPGDDWTGMTNSVERKKRQNRLNQRAWRKRQKNRPQKFLPTLAKTNSLANDAVQYSQPCFSSTALTLRSNGIFQLVGDRLPSCPHKSALIRALMRRAYEDYSLKAPQPSYLQTLIRLNVLNGLARNATAMGFAVEGLCSDDFVSPYCIRGPRWEPTILSPLCPTNLFPTDLQREVRHHPWIDLFPFPGMRDNILYASLHEALDEDELCGDLLNVEDDSPGEKAALVLWGDSWDVYAWEATTTFLRKWGWLTEGCPELLQATNAWRVRRGEEKLNLGLSSPGTI